MNSSSKRRAASASASASGNNKANSNSNLSKRNKTHANGPMDVDSSGSGANNGNSAMLLLDLQRLLHVMETDPCPHGKTARDLLGRADVLRAQFQRVVILSSSSSSTDSSTSTIKTNRETAEAAQELASRVEAAYQAAQSAAAAVQQQSATTTNAHNNNNNDPDDPVQKIFFPKTGTASLLLGDHVDVVDGDDYDYDTTNCKKPAAMDVGAGDFAVAVQKLKKKQAPTTSTTSTTVTTNVQALQQQQREQTEQAVAAMAQQMKDQTSQIHAQLKQQTVTLDVLEDVATRNVASVTQVAERTRQHSRDAYYSWGKTIGKWTLLITVLVAFVVSLLIISTIPKRPSACLFFCKSHQQFCRTVHGKQECLDSPLSATTKPTVGAVPEVPPQEVHHQPSTTTTEPTTTTTSTTTEPNRSKSQPSHQTHTRNDDNYDETGVDHTLEPDAWDEDEEEAAELLPYHDPVYQQAARAAAQGAFKELRRILKDRPDLINVQDGNGWTLLMEASQRGKTEAVRVLLHHHANVLVEAYDENRRTALSLAREMLGDPHAVVTLLEHAVAQQQQQEEEHEDCHVGMDGECLPSSTDTAANTEQSDNVILEVPQSLSAEEMRQQALREYELQQQQQQEQQQQQQHQHDVQQSIPEEQDQQEEVWEEEGNDNDTDDDDDDDEGMNEAMAEDEDGEHATAEDEEHDTDNHDATDESDDAPSLEFTSWQVRDAAQRGDYDQMSKYVGFVDADGSASTMLDVLEEGDGNGWNALHLAVRAGHEEIVELLLAAGCQSHTRTNSGSTPLDLAVMEYGDEHPMIELLMRYP